MRNKGQTSPRGRAGGRARSGPYPTLRPPGGVGAAGRASKGSRRRRHHHHHHPQILTWRFSPGGEGGLTEPVSSGGRLPRGGTLRPVTAAGPAGACAPESPGLCQGGVRETRGAGRAVPANRCGDGPRSCRPKRRGGAEGRRGPSGRPVRKDGTRGGSLRRGEAAAAAGHRFLERLRRRQRRRR